ncbi:MAG: hypothetical protein ABH859_04190 [Pseudomonadota bacterium]
MALTSRRKLEIFIIVLVIVVSVVLLYMKNLLAIRTAKDEALIGELRAIRTAVHLYLSVNKEFPANLDMLTQNTYKINDKDVPYLIGVETDESGYPLDSYGYRFLYEPKTGKVMLKPRKYEGW